LVLPCGIYVAPESAVRRPADLAGVEVGVGYHSGSHFSAIQSLEAVIAPEAINLRFVGQPLRPDRCAPSARAAGGERMGRGHLPA
jgi:NitT/TauT family transport system substrate-binding protein